MSLIFQIFQYFHHATILIDSFKRNPKFIYVNADKKHNSQQHFSAVNKDAIEVFNQTPPFIYTIMLLNQIL